MLQQEFQTILSQEDYLNYLSEKEKFRNYQKIIDQVTQTNDQLEKQNKLLKRSFHLKKAELKYLLEMVQTLITSCNDRNTVQNAVQDSQFQNLVESSINGLSSVEAFEVSQQFQKIYKDKEFEFKKITEMMNTSKQYYKKIRRSNLSQIHQHDDRQHRNREKSTIFQEQMPVEQLRPVQQELEQNSKVIQNLLSEKIMIQKQIEIYKNKVKSLELKINEYEFKMYNNKSNKQDKSYFIKLLIDQFNRDLQKKLLAMQLPRKQVEIIICKELDAIRQYIAAIIPHPKKS